MATQNLILKAGSICIGLQADPGLVWASSVTRHEITWTFDQPYPVGQFVNGDWWVLPNPLGGTVTIASVTPSPQNYDYGGENGWNTQAINGSMVNPAPFVGGAANAHGFDERIYGYTASKSETFPLELSPGDSLVSTQGLTLEHLSGGQYNSIMGFDITWTSVLKTAAVLTCLSSKPSTTAFRPAYSGSTKTIYDFANVDLDVLPSLARPGGYSSTPNADYMVNITTKFWLDCSENFVGRAMHPADHMPEYGRELCGTVGDAAIMLCSDQLTADQKRSIAIGLIQIGIDTSGVVSQDADLFEVIAGQNIGRKFPVVFAALMLNDSRIIPEGSVFSEDAAYYGSDVSPTQTLWTGWQDSGHAYAANVMWLYKSGTDNGANPTGLPVPWYHEHIHPDDWDQSPFPHNGTEYPATRASEGKNGYHEGYRRACGVALVGPALAARILGMQTLWNHDAYFAYVDRWMYEDETIVDGVQDTIDAAGWDAITYVPAQTGAWGWTGALYFAQNWYFEYRGSY